MDKMWKDCQEKKYLKHHQITNHKKQTENPVKIAKKTHDRFSDETNHPRLEHKG